MNGIRNLTCALALAVGIQLCAGEDPARKTIRDKGDLARTAQGPNQQLDTPILSCAGATDDTVTVQICAGASGAPGGFTLQWMSCADLDLNGWVNECHGSFSGNAAGFAWNLGPSECRLLTIGNLPTSGQNGVTWGDVASCNSAQCDTCYAFRAFAHTGGGKQRSADTCRSNNRETCLRCNTEPCPPPEGFPPYCGFTQGFYGMPNGNDDWTAVFGGNFGAMYPTGLTFGTGARSMTLTSAGAVQNYLPCGGTPGVLSSACTGTCSNPSCTTGNSSPTGGILSGQGLTLKINIDVNSGFVPAFGDLEFCNWTTVDAIGGFALTQSQADGLNAYTVSSFLAAVEAYAGGAGLVPAPAGLTRGQLVFLMDTLNQAFDLRDPVTGDCLEDESKTGHLCLP